MNDLLSAAQSLLGAGYTQQDRLLELTTVLGPNVLLAEEALISEVMGPLQDHAGYVVNIMALSADANLDLSALMGQPARIGLLTAHSRTERRPIHGYITSIERQASDGGFCRYQLTLEPYLAFLGVNQNAFIWQQKTVIEIVDDVLSRWQGQGKLVPNWRWELLDPSIYPKRGMTTQYFESDLAFIKRLLAESGIFYRFEHQSSDDDTLGSHTLVLCDHNTACPPNQQDILRYTQAGVTLPVVADSKLSM